MATLQDIQYHYDVGNDFFTLFLDRNYEVYSCAVWQDADTLEIAQERKLNRIASFANVKPDSSVLDIGCGWGGMLRFLLEQRKAKELVGLTLSQEQFNFIKALNIQEIDVKVCSWDNFSSDKKFDAIVSVGAFEHFASLEDKASGTHMQVYKKFFENCHQLSNERSNIGLQTIVLNKTPSNLNQLRDTRYLIEKVFPGSSLPRVEEIQTSMSSFYEVKEFLSIGQDYVKTLAEWKRRLLQSELQAVAQYDRELFDHYLKYFDSAQRNFEDGIVDLVQFSLKRID